VNFGFAIASPGPITAVGSFEKKNGSVGIVALGFSALCPR
jgi:hypothetical protein